MPHHKNSSPSPDLGYHWIWTYGHLIPTAAFTAGAALAAMLGAPWWVWLPLALIALWAFAGFLVMRFGVRMNQIARLPAKDFLPGDRGTVLDVGCGSGRLTISILRARPNVTVVGLDNFSADYISGHDASNTERNFQLAGIADRATVQTGDMRDMPFPDASFDGAASSAAIDHLKPDEIRQTLREIRRVVVPGGSIPVAGDRAQRLADNRVRAVDGRPDEGTKFLARSPQRGGVLTRTGGDGAHDRTVPRPGSRSRRSTLTERKGRTDGT